MAQFHVSGKMFGMQNAARATLITCRPIAMYTMPGSVLQQYTSEYVVLLAFSAPLIVFSAPWQAFPFKKHLRPTNYHRVTRNPFPTVPGELL